MVKFSPKVIPVRRIRRPFHLFLRVFSCVPHERDCQFLEKLRCSFCQFGLYPYLRNLNPKEELHTLQDSFPFERLCILNSKCSFVFLLKKKPREGLPRGNPILNRRKTLRDFFPFGLLHIHGNHGDCFASVWRNIALRKRIVQEARSCHSS